MKQFLVILCLTALVWLGVSISEPTEFPLRAKIEMVGYDTVRYAVLRADTAVTLRVETEGYRAILYGLRHKQTTLQVPVEGDASHYSVPATVLYDILQDQMSGIKSVSSNIDSVRIVLAERCHRVYRPSLDRVSFSFAEQYGLYGQPKVSPDEVILYGPEEALAAIDELPVAKASVDDIKASGSFTLALEPVWKQYADVHPSCSEVSVYVPVETYVEREWRVPIKVLGADTNVELRLYPDEAMVHVWVAKRDMHRTPEFEVAIDYSDVVAHKEPLSPRLVSFPSYVRARSVEPKEVQCVIIK